MPIDYSKYPKNWKTVIRPAILKRAENKCEQCKVPNREIIARGFWDLKQTQPVWQNDDGQIYCAGSGQYLGDNYVCDLYGKVTMTRVVLTISHTDHDITNNDYSNLKALCQRCHLSHDKQHHMANSKATRRKKKGMEELF